MNESHRDPEKPVGKSTWGFNKWLQSASYGVRPHQQSHHYNIVVCNKISTVSVSRMSPSHKTVADFPCITHLGFSFLSVTTSALHSSFVVSKKSIYYLRGIFRRDAAVSSGHLQLRMRSPRQGASCSSVGPSGGWLVSHSAGVSAELTLCQALFQVPDRHGHSSQRVHVASTEKTIKKKIHKWRRECQLLVETIKKQK